MASDTQRCLQVFGNPSSKQFAAQWLVRHELPDAVKPYFPPYDSRRPTAIYMNRYAVKALDAVLLDLLHTGLIKELKTYNGCWSVRKKVGLNEYSIHSWGLALDFNAALNPLGAKWGSRPGMFSGKFIEVWERHGWTAGMWWNRPDGMHFQFTDKLPTPMNLAGVKDKALAYDLALYQPAEIQSALVNLGRRIQVDGKVGPLTIAAINQTNSALLRAALA